MPKKGYVNMILRKTTRDALLKIKLGEQAKLGKKLTWDEFLLGAHK